MGLNLNRTEFLTGLDLAEMYGVKEEYLQGQKESLLKEIDEFLECLEKEIQKEKEHKDFIKNQEEDCVTK